ncbi:MAG TPA: glycine cleavage T C-terminal barrel domain-containing protein, partial [Pirellulales bacterium]
MNDEHPPAAGGATRHRLPPQPAEWIDRERPLRFRFEGSTYYGFAGDTISTALAANGVRLLGRSFKYHRPRGIYSLANHDVNVLVAAGEHTNVRADVTPLWEGAELTAVNTIGGLRDDLARHTDKAGRFLPVGFYYKTFHKPRGLFPFWERQMRAMAGLGAVDPLAPRRRTPKRYDWCDVLVVGAGPSGLAAAIAAAERGLSVLLVDEQSRVGGSLHYQGEPSAGAATLRSLSERAQTLPNLRIAGGAVAAGYYADHWVALVDDRRLTKLRARSVVFATGVFEQPALFRNNDLPGVMLAGAAQRLTRQYAVKPFERPLVLAANSDGYRAALDMRRVGVQVHTLVDLRPEGELTELARQAAQAGIEIHLGHAVYEAVSGGDLTGISAVMVCPLDGDGLPLPTQTRRVECDGLLMSVGWAPADSLFCQARGKMRYAPEVEQFVPDVSPPGVFTAGRLNGIYTIDDRLLDGRSAGAAAADYVLGTTADRAYERPAWPRVPPSHPFPVVDHPAGKVFVDLDEDVQLKDIEHAVQEGFDGVELLKRYSTFGMGPSQGKIANTNTLRVLNHLRGEQMGQTGSPTARPFFHPVPLSQLAGRGFHPHRETALHARHEALGATFMPAGDWLRPAFYGAAGDRDRAVATEVEAVRQRAGLIDVSTLGKLEVAGADAAEFLERIYTGRFAKMKAGATRYGLMCDESGVVIDDGVIGRVAEDRFYVTTTTSASGSVYREMQRWAILWRLDVTLANLTGVFAAMNLAGPYAPALLAALTDLDLSDSGFPYLALREAEVLGAACRLLRTGFVGEVGYEIHVPARSAAHVWDGLMRAGAHLDVRPFGVEAQRVLRLEKGHVIVSQDTDGLTNPHEAGMAWAVKDDKPFFVGGRSLRILGRKPLKRRLVGFTLSSSERGPLPSECHLVIERGEIVGRVTSIALSPTLGYAIGLAYVQPSQASPGTRFQIRGHGGRMAEATVVELPFYDRANLRQKVRPRPK